MVDRSLIACGKRCGWMPPLILNLKVIFKDEKGQIAVFFLNINLDHNQNTFYVDILASHQCN